ncbi:MAG: hypothetical protein E6H05_03435 [Bacillati bacterium ANGP1]|uniref:Uncharacterized protein n=1 Tax=Candidatus Segetimicrobium genomatis TaxID=2569760 RepID=A0A537IYY4_9BACT|nr:MAG: hypothetical protein E6H05_03435 [Terrabacteria group bacterium ANGP1]
MDQNTSSFLLSAFLVSGCILAPLRAQTSPQTRDTADLAFVCEWQPRPPITRRVIVDLSLHAGQFNRTPNGEDVRAVQAAGGRVLYQFRVALLRAELDTGAVRALVTGPAAIADAAFTVPDPSNFDAGVQIFYKRPITDADEEALRQLGVYDSARMPIPVLQTASPDSLIPRIAALPGVQFVRATAYGGCVELQQRGVPGGSTPRPGRLRSNMRLKLPGAHE